MQPSTAPYALVVEDEALILMQACDILIHAGFRCHEAMDGDNAIALLEQRHEEVTLLFSDVDLGIGMSGFELARHVDQHWPHIEIVIASGHVLPLEAEMPGRATFIPKPFSERIVVEHLANKLPDGKKPKPLKRAVQTRRHEVRPSSGQAGELPFPTRMRRPARPGRSPKADVPLSPQ